MTLTRGLRRILYALAALAVVIAAVIIGAPHAAHALTVHYLSTQGVTATIDAVDVNLFTGRIEYRNARGETDAGDGFEIGRLAVSIDYPPLLSKRISLSRVALEEATVDIRRTADNNLRVAGVPVTGGSSSDGGGGWGFALHRLTVDGLALHYRQPEIGDQPAIDREIVFDQSGARDLVTWQTDNTVSVDADMTVGEGRIGLEGRVVPFGDELSAQFEIETNALRLELLSPVARRGGLKTFTGRLDAEQRVDLRYRADSGLDMDVEGEAEWRDSRLALGDGVTAASRQADWSGRVTMRLMRADGEPGSIETDGRLDTADLDLQAGGSSGLEADSAHWQGSTRTTLTADGIRAGLDGTLSGQNMSLTSGSDTRLHADRFDSRGTTRIDMATAEGAPGRITTDSALDATGLDIRGPAGFSLRQPQAHWQGTSTTTFAAAGPRIETDGRLTAGESTLSASGGTRFESPGFEWQGTTATTLAAEATTVDSEGRLQAEALTLAVGDSLTIDGTNLDWQGTTHTVADGAATRIETDGTLSSADFAFRVPESGDFTASTLEWHGDFSLDMAALTARRARGRVIASEARTSIAGADLAITSQRIVFNGEYAEQPAGDTLRLSVDGDVDGHEFAVMNTAIDAAWVSMLQGYAKHLSIDGLDDIALESLETSGLRLLGDTNTDVAVLEAVTGTARRFRLTDLRHYRLADLDIADADIHLRRDGGGMGVISEFFGGGASDATGGTNGDSEGGADSDPGSTFALDHLGVSGPRIQFHDVSVTPDVALNGANINFVLENLDTGQTDNRAEYRLALDVGAYGHLDSRGEVSPMGRGGLDMEADAWLRSLALPPLSGYMNAALGRRIAGGVADGTLSIDATNGELDGNLDTTLANFRLADDGGQATEIAFGINMDTALALVRGQDDLINFETAILGDVSNPYFSIRNLVREAILAGLRTALTSDYSPVGLLNRAKNAMMDLTRSLASRPVIFVSGKHYVQSEDRLYLARLAQAMREDTSIELTVTGHAVPGDRDGMALFHGEEVDVQNALDLRELARLRGEAVRDYLAARNVNPDRITTREPVVERSEAARPRATFTISGN